MTETNKKYLVFRPELDVLKTEEIRNFAVAALDLADPVFYECEHEILHVKKVFRIVHQLLEDAGTDGSLKDAMLTAVLISDLGATELSDYMVSLHPIAIRPLLDPIKTMLNGDIYRAILAMAEGHEAELSPSPAIEPKPGTPGHIIAFANKIARMEFVSIEVE